LYPIQALDLATHRGQRTNIRLYGGHFKVGIGPGTNVSNHSSDCQFQLELDYEGGLQFALSGVETDGYAELGSGVSASFSYTFNFGDDSAAGHTYGTVLSGGGVWAQGQAFTRGDTQPLEQLRLVSLRVGHDIHRRDLCVAEGEWCQRKCWGG
jgi:hypothetical protein